jgi:hypothetical protein
VARAALSTGLWLLATAIVAAQPAAAGSAEVVGDGKRQAVAALALVAPCQTRDIDPIVGRFVDRQLRRTLAELGYRVMPRAQAVEVLSSVDAEDPPTMVDLWRATQRAGAERAVLAVAWAEAGRYVVQVRVASRDGRGPFYARGDAGVEGLEPTVDRLLREALPESRSEPDSEAGSGSEPVTATESESVTGSESGSVTGSATATESGSGSVTGSVTGSESGSGSEPPSRFFTGDAPAPAPLRRWRLSLLNEYAFGLADDGFFNLLIGARALYRLDRTLSVGGSLAYVNLPTRNGRGGSVLPAVSLQHSVEISGTDALSVPLGLQLGYLIDNGAVMQLSSGLAHDIDERLRLSLHLLAPTFWITPERVLFSLNLGLELGLDF